MEKLIYHDRFGLEKGLAGKANVMTHTINTGCPKRLPWAKREEAETFKCPTKSVAELLIKKFIIRFPVQITFESGPERRIDTILEPVPTKKSV